MRWEVRRIYSSLPQCVNRLIIKLEHQWNPNQIYHRDSQHSNMMRECEEEREREIKETEGQKKRKRIERKRENILI